jgi:pimeloyl-ACP methyl ester carboxylesterase
MPFLTHGSHRIRYELAGPKDGPAYVFVNGLTQYAALWTTYRDALIARQFRVATFDLLGQGDTDKPSLFIRQDDGDKLAGLVPMSCFAELSRQLLLIGNALRIGLILGGTSYLQGWLVNDVYALQNLMESFLDFEPLTPQLSAIRIPTMILKGEFDFLTPRALHETLRVHIPESALVIIPRAFHAFTLEKWH